MVKNGEEENIFSDTPRHTKSYIGALGEKIASQFLKKKGFSVLEMNYRKKWGEIDIVAEKNRKIHFVEVKTVSRDLSSNHLLKDWYRPEDNIHPYKLQRLHKAINSYLIEKGSESEMEWQLDLVSVYLDISHKKAKIEYLENIV